MTGAAQTLNFRAAADYSATNQGDAVVVMQNGVVVFEEYQNGYNGNTPHLLASGTKSFSCAIAVKAQEEKLINLDEPVANVIASWRLNSPNPAPQVNWKSQVTARHLLSLTSGLTAEGEVSVLVPSVDVYQQALTTRSVYPPNFGAHYGSNTFAAFAAYYELSHR